MEADAQSWTGLESGTLTASKKVVPCQHGPQNCPQIYVPQCSHCLVRKGLDDGRRVAKDGFHRCARTVQRLNQQRESNLH